MPIYLIRHATAVPEDRDLTDADRYLAPEGRSEARAVGAKLKRIGIALDRVWTSPLVRAVQTAELMCGSLGHSELVVADLRLSPGGDVRDLGAAIPRDGATALVGHEPSLSALAGVLCAERVKMLGKAEVVCIDGGRIEWRMAMEDSEPRMAG